MSDTILDAGVIQRTKPFPCFYKMYYLIVKESFKLQLKVIPCTIKLAFFFPQLDVEV